MSDPRYDKLAKLLVEYSCGLKKGESVFIDVADIPDRMTIALIRAARKVGSRSLRGALGETWDTAVLEAVHRCASRTDDRW